MVLVRPLGMIFPGATATIWTVPMHAKTSATANTAMIVNAIARPVGEGGVSTISSAAGRNASSSLRRSSRFFGNSITFLADFMQPLRLLRESLFLAPLDTPPAGFVLEPIEGCVSAADLDQVAVGAILDQSASLDGDDAGRHPQRREPMCNNEHRASTGDLRHILLNNALALVVERACRLVENEDARVGN